MSSSPTLPGDKSSTPGTWEVHHATDVTGYPCYFIHGFSGDAKRDTAMHDANARLIAAAPDLLAACEAALNDRMFKDWPEVATVLKNAIKKARGE